MPTAKKRAFKNYSMPSQSRNKAYAAINILWNQMRPDLRFENKDAIREERLSWIADFLDLKKLASTTKLSDQQIGRVLEEMKRMTGQPVQTPQVAPKPKPTGKYGIVGVINNSSSGESEFIHCTTPEQLYTLEKLETYIGWTKEWRERYLKPRFKRTSFKALEVTQANALMMQMLAIAAQKDLKLIIGNGKPISRDQIRKYIPTLKKKLGIDR